MAIWIHVLCASAEPVTYGEPIDVMGHMGWLDRPALFAPPLDAGREGDTTWATCLVTYDPKMRPIIVHRRATKEQMAPGFEDVHESLDGLEDSATKREILRRVDATQQMFVFEIPNGELPQDVWEMLDAIETHLARERDGIIIANEGVFDGQLNQLLVFSKG